MCSRRCWPRISAWRSSCSRPSLWTACDFARLARVPGGGKARLTRGRRCVARGAAVRPAPARRAHRRAARGPCRQHLAADERPASCRKASQWFGSLWLTPHQRSVPRPFPASLVGLGRGGWRSFWLAGALIVSARTRLAWALVAIALAQILLGIATVMTGVSLSRSRCCTSLSARCCWASRWWARTGWAGRRAAMSEIALVYVLYGTREAARDRPGHGRRAAGRLRQHPRRASPSIAGQAAIETASEVPVLFKTSPARRDALMAALAAGHDYELPAIELGCVPPAPRMPPGWRPRRRLRAGSE